MELLLEQRERLSRQIAVLEADPANFRDQTPERERLATELQYALAEIDAEIADQVVKPVEG